MTRSATYTKGDVIIVEGSHTSEVYALTRGSVEVYRQGPPERRLAVLCSPNIFGEMALITEQPRSASVRALEDIEVSILDIFQGTRSEEHTSNSSHANTPYAVLCLTKKHPTHANGRANVELHSRQYPVIRPLL